MAGHGVEHRVGARFTRAVHVQHVTSVLLQSLPQLRGSGMVQGGQMIQEGVGQFVDRGGGQRKSPASLDRLLDFTILPMLPETRQSDLDDQIEGIVTLPRHQLMIALGVVNLAAFDALFLHLADPRFAQHPSQRVASPTALTAQLSAADAEGPLAGHFQPIVPRQSARRRQGSRPVAQQLGADFQELESPFFTESW